MAVRSTVICLALGLAASQECGNFDSADCLREYENGRLVGSFEAFFARCEDEEGADPLRSRCSLCCGGSPETSDEGYCCFWSEEGVDPCLSSVLENRGISGYILGRLFDFHHI